MDGSWWRVLGKRGPAGEGNGKSVQYSCLENPMNSMTRQKDMILKKSREIAQNKNKEAEPKQKHHPVVDVTGDRSKVRCYK